MAKKETPLVVARRLARQSAMQAIYQWEITKMPTEQVITMYKQVNPLNDRIDKIYFEQLLNGVMKNIEKIDKLILPHLTNKLYHLGEVEKAIMRVATYELSFLNKEVESAVCISEAVMMAKSYTAEKSYTFVNAVLDNIKKELKLN